MEHATVIRYTSPDADYSNLVHHKCTCGEFLQDIKREAREYSEMGYTSKMDLFWHLDKYCEETYGACHWQIVRINSLL